MSPTSTATRRPAPRRPAGSRRQRPRSARRRRRQPARAARCWPALVIAVAVMAGAAWHWEDAPEPTPCTVAGVTLTAEQTGHAGTIARVAEARGLPDRAVVIALATAMQESRLRNLDHGDRDSLGLFQQRPSQGWGTPEQVQDPEYAAGRFYDHLVAVPEWQTRELTVVADAVQRSAFPLAYGKWADMAGALATEVLSDRPGPCTRPPDL